jgi:hypothetical protein
VVNGKLILSDNEEAEVGFKAAVKTLAANFQGMNEMYRGLRDTLRETDPTLRNVLPTEDVVGSDLTPAFTVLGHIPILMMKTPNVASMMMVILLHFYQVRITSLVGTIRPLAQTELQAQSVGLWESDFFANPSRA